VTDPGQTFTDIDEYVTLRLDGDKIVVAVTAAGFRQPPSTIARLVTELAARLPRPGAEADAAVANGIKAIGELQQAAASGGYEAFAAMMRGRLGIDAPGGTLSRDPEHDRALAGHLDGVLKTMRAAQTARARPDREQLDVTVHSDEGDLTVTSSAERAVAGVLIAPAARQRGLDGLGEALTDLIARARTELRRAAEQHARTALPADLAQRTDQAPAAADHAARTANDMAERVQRLSDSIQRKADPR
jgi:DNA-binding protein YbaB